MQCSNLTQIHYLSYNNYNPLADTEFLRKYAIEKLCRKESFFL
jgi:hypothetical protein